MTACLCAMCCLAQRGCVLLSNSADEFEREVLRNSRPHFNVQGKDYIHRYVWVPDNALHLDALFSGTSPLHVAVSSGQHQAAELLLAAGAHSQRACFVDPAGGLCCGGVVGVAAHTVVSSSDRVAVSGQSLCTDNLCIRFRCCVCLLAHRVDAYDKESLSSGKKKKKGASTKGDTQHSEGSRGWTTPLHEAARRTDVRMLKLLLTQSKHELVGCSGIQHGFPQVKMPTDHISATGRNSVHALLQKLPLTLLDGAGQTPLSLALCSSSAAAAEAAVLLLDAGLQVLQPVKDLGDSSGRDTVTHALLIAAKVRMLQPLLVWRHGPDSAQVAGGRMHPCAQADPVAGAAPCRQQYSSFVILLTVCRLRLVSHALVLQREARPGVLNCSACSSCWHRWTVLGMAACGPSSGKPWASAAVLTVLTVLTAAARSPR